VVCRLALTDQDRQARDLVTRWFHEAGLSVRVDEVGNVFGRRAGTDPQAAAVATGSHIDTQPSGGKFDGNYGVMAGLEVVRTLNDRGIRTRAPIEVAFWMNEEGSRFTPVMMGSGAFTGVFTPDFVRAQRDIDGLSVGDELARIGYRGRCRRRGARGHVRGLLRGPHRAGPILEAVGRPIGVVAGALGQQWYDVVVTGQDAHAGPTPMALRHDALLATARMIDRVNRIALDEAPHGRGTVGFAQVIPNSRNVIPGEVRFRWTSATCRRTAWTAWTPRCARALPRWHGTASARWPSSRCASSSRRSSTPTAWPACATRPRPWACRTWTWSVAPGTTRSTSAPSPPPA
jgi:N-carbamoyl-L-amino-acid hydrolase